MSGAEKDRSHGRIVDSAARMVRERGMEGTSLGEVMKAAGMTHGGFYKHFETKDALLAAALDRAFDEVVRMFGSDPTPEQAIGEADRFRAFYLSDEHCAHPGTGCPVAGLGGEVARAPDALKARFGEGVRRMAGLLARGMPGSARARRMRALRQLAMMAGAVIMARASDENTARDVLEACRERAA